MVNSLQQRVLIVGCGDVGQRAGQRLAGQGCEVYGLKRNPETLAAPIRALQGDITDPASLAPLQALGRFDTVFITTAAGGSGEARYREVYLDGLANVLAVLAAAPPRRIFLASSTSVYHQHDGSRVDENSATEPAGYAGQVMLAAEAMLVASAIPATVVRFAGIYGPGRTRLLARLRSGVMPAVGNQLSNRIHSDDCAGVLAHLWQMDALGETMAPCYLAVDCAPTPLREVCRWLAVQVGCNPDQLQQQGALQRGGNKYCSNQRLLDAGYRFLYPDYRAGFTALLTGDGSAQSPGIAG
jgi:nucleoside-diphosphate-sugar epimerase